MKKVLLTLMVTVAGSLLMPLLSQNIETLDVERIYDQSIIVPAQCSPEDLIIVFNSSIENLKFESNMLPDTSFQVVHIPETNHYIVCHEKIKFKLTISGPNLQSEDIEIFNLNESYVYRLSSNIIRGTVKINTTPGNATILFPTLSSLTVSSETPIKNNSGKYKVSIIKPHFKAIDTVIVIPRDTTVVNTYSFNLVPLFAQLKLELTTEDNAVFEKAPVLWIDDRRISLDAMLKPNTARRFYDEVIFYQLYENNIIPINEGNCKVRLEADNYIPYETFIHAENGKVFNLPVMMELVYGYITFIDSLNSIGAKVFINDQPSGEVPVFKTKSRVGSNTVRFEKPGFMTDKAEYRINVMENVNTDFFVSMSVSRKTIIESDPTSAEIFLNGTRIGFTPHTTSVPSGNHQVVIKRAGHASENINLFITPEYKEADTLRVILRKNNPLSIRSEMPDLNIYFEGLGDLKNTEIIKKSTLPCELMQPYGVYNITTVDEYNGFKRVTYKGILKHHSGKKKTVLPSFSRTSFSLLTADYIDNNSFEGSFGRIHIFPSTGLSTSLINVGYNVFDVNDTLFKTISPHVFFLNWDWRIGGSILRQLDICLLGRVKWTPGLNVFNVNLLEFHDAQLLTYFYGVEISSRLPYINFNCKIGRQVMEGDLHVWENDDYRSLPDAIALDKMVVSIGVTLNGRVGRSNNMLRLWKKPAVDQIRDKFFR